MKVWGVGVLAVRARTVARTVEIFLRGKKYRVPDQPTDPPIPDIMIYRIHGVDSPIEHVYRSN